MDIQYQKRPLIGIFPARSDIRINLSQNYLDAIYHAGGLGVPLAYTTDPAMLQTYVDMMDGFLWSGGVDIDPALYGEAESSPLVKIDALRDAFELTAFPMALVSGKPMLGICRGIQIINVAMGGTLYQHIDNHRQDKHGVERTHPIFLEKQSYLYHLIGKDEIMVNSFHHQNIKALGNGLAVDGVSHDGYIEAVHAPNHKFLVGVQFHPEYYHNQPDDDHSFLIFKALVDACQT